MDKIVKTTLLIILVGLLFGCKKDEAQRIRSLDSLKDNSYYNKEVLPNSFTQLYGKWGLEAVTGGISGGGHELTYSFLILKPYGIYGILRSDTLIEYGKIETDTTNQDKSGMLKINFIPEFYSGSSLISPPEKYAYTSQDTLILYSPCCDMYNYHYLRHREE